MPRTDDLFGGIVTLTYKSAKSLTQKSLAAPRHGVIHCHAGRFKMGPRAAAPLITTPVDDGNAQIAAHSPIASAARKAILPDPLPTERIEEVRSARCSIIPALCYESAGHSS